MKESGERKLEEQPLRDCRKGIDGRQLECWKQLCHELEPGNWRQGPGGRDLEPERWRNWRLLEGSRSRNSGTAFGGRVPDINCTSAISRKGGGQGVPTIPTLSQPFAKSFLEEFYLPTSTKTRERKVEGITCSKVTGGIGPCWNEEGGTDREEGTVRRNCQST